MRRTLRSALALLLAAAAARPAAAALCTLDPVPGATLLYPIFEVDVASPATHDTVLTVTNVGESAVIAHVTLWTDWAVPVLDFDVYLARFDVQTIDLEDVIVDGTLPVTGSAVSPHGPMSGSPVAFPGCNNTAAPGNGPVYQNPALGGFFLAQLQAALKGQLSQTSGGCVGSNRGNSIARGYVTIDANRSCTLLFPSSAGYFAANGPASRRNVLVGDLAILRPGAAYASSFPAVALEAAADGQPVPGGRTFYGRYLAGSGEDGREPLPTTFEARILAGGAFNGGSDLVVWRETAGGNPGAVPCGTSPAWAPLATSPLVYFDEQENVTDVVQGFPIALDVQANQSPYSFGRAVLDLQHAGVTPLYGSPAAQGWVAWISKATARFAGSIAGEQYPTSCTP
jgi:hypothetical protein